MKFKDKITLITGSNRGIGKSILRLFASEGAVIFAHARSYFEPFVQENIPLNFFTTYDLDKVWIFKGDGDQDRPNQLREQN